jgi:drug/metabolite transporter (DMT)-like permease
MVAAGVPLWAVVFQLLFHRQTIAPIQFVSLTIGFAGMSLIFIPALSSVSGNDLYKPFALFLVLLAPLTWAIGTMLQRPLQDAMSPAVAASLQLAVGGISWFVIALVEGSPLPRELSATQVAAFLYLSMFAGALCFISFIKVTRYFSPHIASTFAYVNPVIALLLAWLLLGEQIAVASIIGIAIVIGSIIVLLAKPLPHDSRALRP